MLKLSLKLKQRSYCYASLNTVRLNGFCSNAAQEHSLHRRIPTHMDPTASIAPVLDQWVDEGHNKVDLKELHQIINGLRLDCRFKHALEVYQWMSDIMKYKLSKGDVAVQFDLISKVHGSEQAEKYLNNIEEECNRVEPYANILKSYVREKSVHKAEILMNKLRDMGLSRVTICYNAMLNLYRQINNRDKIDALLREMEERDVKQDRITFSLLLGIYANASDIEGIEKVLQKMEYGTKVRLDWDLYSTAANCFIKNGLYEKAFVLLKKSESFVTPKNRSDAFDILLRQYAQIGKKEDVFRIWDLQKQKDKPDNKRYINAMNSLIKMDDLESAEKIFDEWESSELSYDFLVPNILVGAYCNKGLVEKAVAFIEREKIRGGNPIPLTFYYLATGFIVNKEMEKAFEAMKIAVSTCKIGWRPSVAKVEACLVHLKEKCDVEEATRFLRLLIERDAISADMYSRFTDNLMRGGDIRMEGL